MNKQVIDKQTVDGASSYFYGELIRLAPTAIKPMVEFTWMRDIEVLPIDVDDEGYAYDVLSYTGIDKKVSWISGNQTELGAVGVKRSRQITKTAMVGDMIRKTIHELRRAQKLGQNLDEDLFGALNAKMQQDMNIITYFGDADVIGYGMLNNPNVTRLSSAVAGTDWVSASADVVVKAVIDFVQSVRTKTLVMPNKIMLPYDRYVLLTQKFMNTAGTETALDFLLTRSVFATQNGGNVKIVPADVLVGAGNGGKDRMVAYKEGMDTLLLPASELSSTPVEQEGFHLKALYYRNVGAPVIKRPELMVYQDFA